MPIRTVCPGCGHVYQVPEARAGQVADCKECGEEIVVPLPMAGRVTGLSDRKGVNATKPRRAAAPMEAPVLPRARAPERPPVNWVKRGFILGGLGLLVLLFWPLINAIIAVAIVRSGGVRSDVVAVNRDEMTDLTTTTNRFADLLASIDSTDDFATLDPQLSAAVREMQAVEDRVVGRTLPVSPAEIRALMPEATAFRAALLRAIAEQRRLQPSPHYPTGATWTNLSLLEAVEADMARRFPGSLPAGLPPAPQRPPLADAPAATVAARPDPGPSPDGRDNPGRPRVDAGAFPNDAFPPSFGRNNNSSFDATSNRINREFEDHVAGSEARMILFRLNSRMTSQSEGAALLGELAAAPLSNDARDDVMTRVQEILAQFSSNPAIVKQAYAAMVHWAGPEHAEVLTKALAAPNVPTTSRRDLATALGQMGDLDSLPTLREVAKSDRSSVVKQAAEDAIKAIESKDP